MVEVECLTKLQISSVLWSLRKSHLPQSSYEVMWLTDGSVCIIIHGRRKLAPRIHRETKVITFFFLWSPSSLPHSFRLFTNSSNRRLLVPTWSEWDINAFLKSSHNVNREIYRANSALNTLLVSVIICWRFYRKWWWQSGNSLVHSSKGAWNGGPFLWNLETDVVLIEWV